MRVREWGILVDGCCPKKRPADCDTVKEDHVLESVDLLTYEHPDLVRPEWRRVLTSQSRN